MNTTLRPTDREDIARRLLRSSAKASYDPLTAIDIPNLIRETGDKIESCAKKGRLLTFKIRKS